MSEPTGSKGDMEACSLEVATALRKAEAQLEVAVTGIARGHMLGMIDKPERDYFAHGLRMHVEGIKMLHSQLTGVSARHGADGTIQPLGGPGR